MTYILDLQGFSFNLIFTNCSAHLDADAMSRLFRFTDSVDELTVPLPSFGDIEDDDLRNLLALQDQQPSTLKQASRLIQNMCTDFEYLDYVPDPRLLFPQHEDTAPAAPAASLPDRDKDDEDPLLPPPGSPTLFANTVHSTTTPRRLSPTCPVPLPFPSGYVRDTASPQGSRITTSPFNTVPSYIDYHSNITIPTFVNYVHLFNNAL